MYKQKYHNVKGMQKWKKIQQSNLIFSINFYPNCLINYKILQNNYYEAVNL